MALNVYAIYIAQAMPSISSAKGNAALMSAGLASGRAVVHTILAADLTAMVCSLLVEASEAPRVAGLWASGVSTGGYVMRRGGSFSN